MLVKYLTRDKTIREHVPVNQISVKNAIVMKSNPMPWVPDGFSFLTLKPFCEECSPSIKL